MVAYNQNFFEYRLDSFKTPASKESEHALGLKAPQADRKFKDAEFVTNSEEEVPSLDLDTESEVEEDYDKCSIPDGDGEEYSSAASKVVLAAEQVKKDMKISHHQVEEQKSDHYKEDFKIGRRKLMTIIVKYISTKIDNAFPSASSPEVPRSKISLETFLLVLTTRLQLPLGVFMKGVIYLFRYMHIVYLLRYLNQSNNFANYNAMDFDVKRLLVGCFKIACAGENMKKDWSRATGLPEREIEHVAKTMIKRMNCKINIKNTELMKLRNEIFYFVRLVTIPV